jgi:hypothetical protein
MTSLTFKPRVPVFDANVRVGDASDIVSTARNRAGLLAELDRHGVERAVIYHADAEERSPVDGNRLLETWLAGDGRLFPQWAALPTADSLAQLQTLHAQGRVQSVRLCPTKADGLPFRPWAFDALLGWLSKEHVPVWIALPDFDADDIVSTLQEYPHIVSVLVGAHYVHALWVRPMLGALPNAYLELSRYEPIGELESLRDEFGAGRLVYGSWYSRYVMGPMLFYLHQTSLTDAELRMVCAGNLERILRGEGQHD